jgi:hypothetical protein
MMPVGSAVLAEFAGVGLKNGIKEKIEVVC